MPYVQQLQHLSHSRATQAASGRCPDHNTKQTQHHWPELVETPDWQLSLLAQICISSHSHHLPLATCFAPAAVRLCLAIGSLCGGMWMVAGGPDPRKKSTPLSQQFPPLPALNSKSNTLAAQQHSPLNRAPPYRPSPMPECAVRLTEQTEDASRQSSGQRACNSTGNTALQLQRLKVMTWTRHQHTTPCTVLYARVALSSARHCTAVRLAAFWRPTTPPLPPPFLIPGWLCPLDPAAPTLAASPCQLDPSDPPTFTNNPSVPPLDPSALPTSRSGRLRCLVHSAPPLSLSPPQWTPQLLP